MKKLETVKKELSENNRKIGESLKDIRSLGRVSREENDYDSEGRSISSFRRKEGSSRVRSMVSEGSLSCREVNVLKKWISDNEKKRCLHKTDVS